MDCRLISSCSGDHCSKKKLIEWVHATCFNEIRIDTNCDLWCKSHKDKSFIRTWGFNC